MSLSGNNIVEQQKQQQQQQQCDAGDYCACTASLDAKWCGCVLALRTPHQRQLSRAITTFNYDPIPIRILFPRIQSAAQTYLSKQHSVAKKLVFYYTNCDRGCVNFVLYGLCRFVYRSGKCLYTRLAVWLDYRVSRVRVRVRVSLPGQPCVSTSFGYTHGYGQS